MNSIPDRSKRIQMTTTKRFWFMVEWNDKLIRRRGPGRDIEGESERETKKRWKKWKGERERERALETWKFFIFNPFFLLCRLKPKNVTNNFHRDRVEYMTDTAPNKNQRMTDDAIKLFCSSRIQVGIFTTVSRFSFSLQSKTFQLNPSFVSVSYSNIPYSSSFL